MRHRNGCQSVVLWWGTRPCYYKLICKLYLNSRNLAFKILIVLDNAPGHPQDFLLTHPHFLTWVSVLHHLTPHSCNNLTMESSEHLICVTFTTPFTISWMEVRRTSLVSLNALNYTVWVIVLNIRVSADKLETSSLNDCWDELFLKELMMSRDCLTKRMKYGTFLC